MKAPIASACMAKFIYSNWDLGWVLI